MRVVTSLSELQRGRPAIITIGTFDGVHRGHQFLVRQVIARAGRLDYDSAVLTFDPRPQVLLRPGSRQLTGGNEKVRIFKALDPDICVLLDFTRELSKVPAGAFLLEILEHLNVAEIWVGADFAFGHEREGDVAFLIHAGQQNGFDVHVVSRQKLDGLPISSTEVRNFISNGDVSGAARLMGHYFRLPGEVVSGAGRGAGLGFPTANLRIEEDQLLPAQGIYAGYLHIDDSRHPAAVSIGHNIQFGGTDLVVEAHVLDFDADLRGRFVALDVVERLRDEQRFDTVDDLVREIERDVQRVRVILSEAQQPGELILSP